MKTLLKGAMFSRTKEPSLLELEIDRAVRELVNHPIGSEEYNRTLDSIVKLHKMKEEEKPSEVSKDTLSVIGANLLGIFMIITYERAGNVISTFARNLILKPRI
jgi:hypothetical protein